MDRNQIELTLPAEHRYLRLLASAVAIFIEDVEELKAIAYNLELDTDEAFTNVVDHVYEGLAGNVHILLCLDEVNARFVAQFTDYGRSFSEQVSKFPPNFWQRQMTPEGERYLLNEVPEPDIEQIRGRGLFLMKTLLDEVSCLVQAQGNVWRLTKYYR